MIDFANHSIHVHKHVTFYFTILHSQCVKKNHCNFYNFVSLCDNQITNMIILTNKHNHSFSCITAEKTTSSVPTLHKYKTISDGNLKSLNKLDKSVQSTVKRTWSSLYIQREYKKLTTKLTISCKYVYNKMNKF